MQKHNQGLLLAVAALLLWSTSAASTAFGGGRVGAWQFLGLATLIAGVLQVVACRVQLKMPLKKIFAPPPKMMALIFLTFTPYMVVYTLAMVTAAKPQKVGVGLLNYLWPTLTVVFATFLVPGSKMTGRLAAALALALSGAVLANFDGLKNLSVGTSLLPYLLGLTAGILWAVYSAMLARWKSWAGEYTTTPLGFLAASAVSFAMCLRNGEWVRMDAVSWLGILYMAVCVLATAYLLWELALHRAPARTLGLIASGNVVLSTLWLFAITPFIPGGGTSPNVLHTALAALLIMCAIVIGRK